MIRPDELEAVRRAVQVLVRGFPDDEAAQAYNDLPEWAKVPPADRSASPSAASPVEEQ